MYKDRIGEVYMSDRTHREYTVIDQHPYGLVLLSEEGEEVTVTEERLARDYDEVCID